MLLLYTIQLRHKQQRVPCCSRAMSRGAAAPPACALRPTGTRLPLACRPTCVVAVAGPAGALRLAVTRCAVVWCTRSMQHAGLEAWAGQSRPAILACRKRHCRGPPANQPRALPPHSLVQVGGVVVGSQAGQVQRDSTHSMRTVHQDGGTIAAAQCAERGHRQVHWGQ